MTEIVPPYLRRRVRVAALFEREIEQAIGAGEAAFARMLMELRDEVLAAIDPDVSGGDSRHG